MKSFFPFPFPLNHGFKDLEESVLDEDRRDLGTSSNEQGVRACILAGNANVNKVLLKVTIMRC